MLKLKREEKKYSTPTLQQHITYQAVKFPFLC